jgi:hypothetical protein
MGFRIRDLPACITVPQRTTLPVDHRGGHSIIIIIIIIIVITIIIIIIIGIFRCELLRDLRHSCAEVTQTLPSADLSISNKHTLLRYKEGIKKPPGSHVAAPRLSWPAIQDLAFRTASAKPTRKIALRTPEILGGRLANRSVLSLGRLLSNLSHCSVQIP